MGMVDEATDFQPIVSLRDTWVRTGDRVDAEAVATGKQATQSGPESAPYDILDLGAKHDSYCAEHPHAQKDPTTHGDA